MVDQSITNLFNEIYDLTNRRVLIFITSKCNNTFDIKDIFQDTYSEFYSVLVKKGSNYIKNYEAFIIKIAKQKIYRYYSLLDRIKVLVPISIYKSSEKVDFIENIQDNLNIEEVVSEKILIEKIDEFLMQKPVIIKKIFYLFYFFNMTISEVANELNLSESSVKNKLYRTLKELRNIYLDL